VAWTISMFWESYLIRDISDTWHGQTKVGILGINWRWEWRPRALFSVPAITNCSNKLDIDEYIKVGASLLGLLSPGPKPLHRIRKIFSNEELWFRFGILGDHDTSIYWTKFALGRIHVEFFICGCTDLFLHRPPKYLSTPMDVAPMAHGIF